MGLFKRKDEEDYIFETKDLLIVFDNETRTSDIKRVTVVEDGAVVVAGHYKVPLLDCEITTGQEGRNFFFRAPTRYIQETERLAQLEMNEVLTQLTAYKPPIIPTGLDWVKGLLFAALMLAIIVMAFV